VAWFCCGFGVRAVRGGIGLCWGASRVWGRIWVRVCAHVEAGLWGVTSERLIVARVLLRAPVLLLRLVVESRRSCTLNKWLRGLFRGVREPLEPLVMLCVTASARVGTRSRSCRLCPFRFWSEDERSCHARIESLCRPARPAGGGRGLPSGSAALRFRGYFDVDRVSRSWMTSTLSVVY